MPEFQILTHASNPMFYSHFPSELSIQLHLVIVCGIVSSPSSIWLLYGYFHLKYHLSVLSLWSHVDEHVTFSMSNCNVLLIVSN